MCLCIDADSIKQATELRKKSGYRVYWKVISKGYQEKLMFSILHSHRWKPGWNKSNREMGTEVHVNELFEGMDRGMHVCLTRDEARVWASAQSNDKIVKVKCYNKDCVAFDKRLPTAVYTKVFLARDEYKSAMKRKTIERK